MKAILSTFETKKRNNFSTTLTMGRFKLCKKKTNFLTTIG